MRLQRLDAEGVARLGGPGGAARRLRSLVPGGTAVEDEVRDILRGVRDGGEAELSRCIRRFDTGGHEPRPVRVPQEELDDAIRTLPLELVAGLQVAIANVAEVADAGAGSEAAVELPQGQRVVLREIPVPSAAVYVPGGRAPYPSTVVMGVVTARSAGVIDVAVCSPPGADAQIHPVILGACRLCGVERVYRMGGAHAVAALAYGTDSVEPVDVIVGPGNLYVQEAKHQLSSIVGIDGFAGPSDLLVLAGAELGEREIGLAALDMLAQGEHGTGSLVVAASPDAHTCDAIAARLQALVGDRPSVADASFALVELSGERACAELANALAPEHLQLMGPSMEALAPLIRTAGCLFVGVESATAFGDYVAGSNHILPTGGAARFASTLSPRHFRRRMSEVRVGRAAPKLAAAGAPIASAEGFAVHAESMRARVGDNPAP